MDETSESQLQEMVIDLLRHYSFETERPLRLLVVTWMGVYPSSWVVKAIIEALYQGRYKVVSVEQILQIWQRRGQPIPHFNYEFERIVCDRILDPVALEAHLTNLSSGAMDKTVTQPPPRPAMIEASTKLPTNLDAKPLDYKTANPLPDMAIAKNTGNPAPAAPLASESALAPASTLAPNPIDPSFPPNWVEGKKPSAERPHSPEPIHQFQPATTASPVPDKLQAIANTATNPRPNPTTP